MIVYCWRVKGSRTLDREQHTMAVSLRLVLPPVSCDHGAYIPPPCLQALVICSFRPLLWGSPQIYAKVHLPWLIRIVGVKIYCRLKSVSVASFFKFLTDCSSISINSIFEPTTSVMTNEAFEGWFERSHYTYTSRAILHNLE